MEEMSYLCSGFPGRTTQARESDMRMRKPTTLMIAHLGNRLLKKGGIKYGLSVDRRGFEPLKIPENQHTYHMPHLSRLAPSFGICQISCVKGIRTPEDSGESPYLP
jgi:hypothetical protein